MVRRNGTLKITAKDRADFKRMSKKYVAAVKKAQIEQRKILVRIRKKYKL